MDKLVEEFVYNLASQKEIESCLSHMEQMIESEWELEGFQQLLKSLVSRTNKLAVGQFVLRLLEAAVSEGYIQAQAIIEHPAEDGDGVDDSAFIPAPIGLGGNGPWCYFHDNCDAAVEYGGYVPPEGWRVDGVRFTAEDIVADVRPG